MDDQTVDAKATGKSLAIAADNVKKIATRIAALYVKASKIAGGMKPLADRNLIEALLVTRGGMSAGDAATLYNLDGILDGRQDALGKSALSIATIKALVEASPDIQERVFRLLAHGQRLEADDIAKIAEHDDRAASTEWETQERARKTYLESLVAKQAASAIRNIETKVDTLVRVIDEFISTYSSWDLNDRSEMLIDRPGYFDAYAEIVEKAGELLPDVDRCFGKGESLDPIYREHGESLAEARHALERFASGKFAHDGRLAPDNPNVAAGLYDLVAALNYLASETQARPADTAPERETAPRIRVLELCAGAGGMAIGLQGAGFEHVALYEKSGVRVDTLKRNWPDWKVNEQDVRRIPDEVLRSYEGVDLIAGGPPCKAFSQTGKMDGAVSKDNLFPEMVRAVSIVKPRAFVFENVLGLGRVPHAPFLAGILREFEELGYRASTHMLDGAQFGLPQSRKRLFLVGLRNDVPSLFQIPTPSPPVERFVAEVLGPAIIRYESTEDLKAEMAENSPQWNYDRWAEKWRESHSRSLIPTVTTFKEEKRVDRLRPWGLAGFDVSQVVVDPPTIEEVESIDWKPRITIEALALSQGFPAGWRFLAEKTGQIAMIGDALPPVMAKAVGLAIRSALTGEGFDLIKAIKEPVIDETRIGKIRRRLRRMPAGYLKASRVADGEPVELVEPNGKRRKPVAAFAEIIATSRLSEAEGEPCTVPSNRTEADHILARQRFLSA
ncbi:DNA cytosine methyltransferase [Rhizobium ruizarguesonis]